MEFERIQPSEVLMPYVDSYYLFHSGQHSQFDDIVFPSGRMEVIFNLGGGTWEFGIQDKYSRTPPVELWGQVTKPLPIRSSGRHMMLGVRFHPHAAGYFILGEPSDFNDKIFDLRDVMGPDVNRLHLQLLETNNTNRRVVLVEAFLKRRLAATKRKVSEAEKISGMVISVRGASIDNGISRIASRYGITTRYLHKIVFSHTGLSPKSINKISRFQNSLRLMAASDLSLTSVALDCGYFDQSHFIREFRSFTGITPSAYKVRSLPVNEATMQ